MSTFKISTFEFNNHIYENKELNMRQVYNCNQSKSTQTQNNNNKYEQDNILYGFFNLISLKKKIIFNHWNFIYLLIPLFIA